jgi:hypothetical protein
MCFAAGGVGGQAGDKAAVLRMKDFADG